MDINKPFKFPVGIMNICFSHKNGMNLNTFNHILTTDKSKILQQFVVFCIFIANQFS